MSQVRPKNEMLCSQIEIVSCQNAKMQVDIHDSLLKANTNHGSKASEDNFFESVPNPYDVAGKKHYSGAIPFMRDYKSGYTPIALQNKEKEVEAQEGYEEEKKEKEERKDNGRGHFIRQKQSTLSLPRSCGVSYVKTSESSQSAPFDPLPPLIFQCSSGCRQTEEERKKHSS